MVPARHTRVNQNKLQVSDLCVVEFQSRDLTPEVSRWKEEHNIPFAESCARQVWYGRTEDFADFPLNNDLVTVRHGAEAYAFLLSLIAGFESKKVSETHIRHQFFDGWDAFRKHHPDQAGNYRSFVKQLRTDSQYVQDRVLSGCKTKKHEYAATDLGGMKKGDQTLIVAGLSRTGDMSVLTEGMIKVIESRQKPHKNHITITHPDDEALIRIRQDIMRLESQGVIRSGIRVIPFDEIFEAVEENDGVYVAFSMGDDPENEALLAELWQGRVRCDNSLILLKGDPQRRGGSIEPWLSADLDQYVAPEAIRAEMTDRGNRNQALIVRAKEMFAVCGEMRLAGKCPRHCMEEEAPELLAEVA